MQYFLPTLNWFYRGEVFSFSALKGIQINTQAPIYLHSYLKDVRCRTGTRPGRRKRRHLLRSRSSRAGGAIPGHRLAHSSPFCQQRSRAGQGRKNPSPRFVIRELNFLLGAVCTEAGVSVDSSELAVAAPPSPGKSYKTSLASFLQMGSHRSTAICRCSRGGFRRGVCTKPNCSD